AARPAHAGPVLRAPARRGHRRARGHAVVGRSREGWPAGGLGLQHHDRGFRAPPRLRPRGLPRTRTRRARARRPPAGPARVRPQPWRAPPLRIARLRAHQSHAAKDPSMKSTLLIALLACCASAHADDAGRPPVVPYRPSVSTPAQLSAPGYLELEAGGLRATGPDHGTSRFTLPYTLKLAFTPDWGIRVGGDAWVRQAEPG